MEAFQKIILDIWREACRHLEISDTLPRIASLLAAHMPVRQILTVRYHPETGELIVLAAGFFDAECPDMPVCLPDEAASLTMRHSRTELSRVGNGPGRLAWLRPKLGIMPDMDFFLAPLGKIAGPDLLLLFLWGKSGQVFTAKHLEMIRALQEPLTLALESDARFREMVRLREAAEADKKTLLKKLSRRSMEDTLIGADHGLKTVIERVNLTAASDVPVLIFGETGTGKELISRLIHQKSNRSEGPFIRVNCGAIPSELIDAQLFGHEKGAFTGAIETRQGWFERADGGTLFLDEIAEMPLEAQVRLLRILQDGWMERVGGRQAIRVDVRIVLATNRDLSSMVASGGFREDLWYRIATFPIFLPPLRDRLQDLRALADHFAGRSAIRFGLPVILPDEEQISLLSAYPWPGNIRELASVMDRAALLGNGERLEIRRALGWWGEERPAAYSSRPSQIDSEKNQLMSLDEGVRAQIIEALKMSQGRVEGRGGAADLLKINPHTLRGKMRKLGIDWTAYRGNG